MSYDENPPFCFWTYIQYSWLNGILGDVWMFTVLPVLFQEEAAWNNGGKTSLDNEQVMKLELEF